MAERRDDAPRGTPGGDDGPDGPLGRDFWRLLVAGTISNVGDGVDTTALPLLAASLTRDPLLFAGVAVAQRVPWLLFALQAGALADRLDRRRVMIGANVARTALLALLAGAVLTGAATIWLLWAVAFGLGTAEVLFDTSAQALLPRVVRRDQLERANGLQMGAEIAGNNFVGPPLGGLLFSVGAALPLLLDAGTFAVAAGLLALVSRGAGRVARGRGPAATASAGGGSADAADVRRSLREDVAEGLAWLRGQPLLWTLAVLLGLMNGTTMLGTAVLPLYAIEEFGLSDVQLGLLLTAAAVGSVLGSALAARLVAAVGRAASLWATLLAAVVVPLVQGLAPSAWVVAVGMVLFGFSAVVWNVITVSLRQAIIPDHLLGRVNAVYRFVGWGAMPIGAALGGLVAGVGGLRAPFLVASAVMSLGLLLGRGTLTAAALDAARAGPPPAGDGGHPR